MFYRGLGPDAPLVESYTSPHRSVRFGGGGAPAAPAAKPAQDKPGDSDKRDNKEPDSAIGKDNVGEKAVDVGA